MAWLYRIGIWSRCRRYDFLREVRGDPVLKRTPFIIMIAEAKTERVIAAKKAGVSNYIVKPFNAESLRMKIEAVFAVRTSALVGVGLKFICRLGVCR